jgi:Sel1 repeat
VVCSACGYANQAGHRFCGMCGTPLPHRPLTAPGAHGTHTFTRFPLGIRRLEREDVGASAEQANGPAPQAQSGVMTEPPGAEQPPARESVSSPAGMVPEIPIDEYVKSFRYVPPADPDETTMRGEAEVLRADAAAVADAPAALPVDPTAAADTPPASATEDVRERLGLDDAAPDDEHHDRPRFLDFSEPTLPPEKPEAPVPAIAGLSILGLNEAPKAAVLSPAGTDAGAPSREAGWNWLAAAALVVVVSLGVLEWRAQGNQLGNAPVEGVKNKLRNAWRSYSPAPQATAAELDGAKPALPAAEQPKPQSQDVQVNANAPIAALTDKSAASTANPLTNAANVQPDTPAVTETQPPAGQQKMASPPSGFAPSGSQPAATQKSAEPKPNPPPDVSKAVTRPKAADRVETAAAKPKPNAPIAQEGDTDIPPRKPIPGAEEMAKASDASDAAAAAAWLSKATAKGNPDAPVRLADMYVKGDGVPRSCEQALTLLKAAANKGNAAARARLAAMYGSGTCVQRDLVKAYRWLNLALAADPNSRWALQNRDSIWQQMTPEERASEPPPH